MNNYSKSILEKYKDSPHPLPVISNPVLNRYIKMACKEIGLDEDIRITTYKAGKREDKICKKYELVTTHTGRRTFITLSLEKGMRAEMVMAISGHKSYSSFKKYIKIVSNTKKDEMNKYWK